MRKRSRRRYRRATPNSKAMTGLVGVFPGLIVAALVYMLIKKQDDSSPSQKTVAGIGLAGAAGGFMTGYLLGTDK